MPGRPCIQVSTQVVAQQRPGRLAREIVATHDGDARTRQSQLGGEPLDDQRGAIGIGGAEVAHNGDPMCEAIGQHRAQFLLEQRLVAKLRVGALGQLLGRERALGEILEDQGGRPAARDEGAHHRRPRIRAIT
ncbi:MAG: hypothetical protein NVS2B4_17450 [Ramlibacter sp.]